MDTQLRAVELWSGRFFEERLVAIEMLARLKERDWPRTWEIADGWVDEATGWALSDSLSMSVIGPLVRNHPELVPSLVRWSSSRSGWRRRASVYGFHLFVRAADLDPPIAQMTRLREDPDPWVQRAVGTWLRESWKKDPERIERFLREHAPHLPSIVRTVATERAGPEFRNELRAMYVRKESAAGGRTGAIG